MMGNNQARLSNSQLMMSNPPYHRFINLQTNLNNIKLLLLPCKHIYHCLLFVFTFRSFVTK